MKIIAYDLGTGGVKASLYDENLTTYAKSFISYETYYPGKNMHEQRPDDWWNGVCESTRRLLEKSSCDGKEVESVALSGHSLVAVLLDAGSRPLTAQVPIWSDTRATAEVEEFFRKISYEKWYMTTGNGFPAACYPIFKLMWYRKEQPELFWKTWKIAGSKDYINLRMTGKLYTDYSYASGFGCYNLLGKRLEKELLEAAELHESLFPEIVPSHHIVGNLLPEAAEALGLTTDTKVVCGGVDNACMALGAVGSEPGRVYASLGSSSWIPVNSEKPVLDFEKKPYVFAHLDDSMYTSAFSIFAGGSSLQWAKKTLCKDFETEEDAYDRISELVSQSPVGANGIFFNPSLAGGTSQDKSPNIRGGFLNLHLGADRRDLLRAVMEGVALNLRNSITWLGEKTKLSDELLVCGGGSKSSVWMQIFADVFDWKIVKTNIDQDSASIGAAATVLKGLGIWKDYSGIQALHHVERINIPDPENARAYDTLWNEFNYISDKLADIGDYLENNH